MQRSIEAPNLPAAITIEMSAALSDATAHQLQQQQQQQRVPVEEVQVVAGTPNATTTTTEILSFACAVPDDVIFGVLPKDPDDPRAAAPPPVAANHFTNETSDKQPQGVGIVGTVTMLGGKSAMVWFGWGRTMRRESTPHHQQSPYTKPTQGSGESPRRTDFFLTGAHFL